MGRVLVLGGTRFVGRAIVDALLPAHDVAVANRGTTPLWDDRIQQVTLDRTDADSCRAALTDRYDVVVDVSGTVPGHVTAVLGSAAVQRASAYVYVSSAAVYDRSETSPPFRETDPVGGDDVWGDYGRDKDGCERVLRAELGGALTVLRPPYVYGPHNSEDREQFGWARMLAGQPVFVPGDGEARLQFCHAGYLGAVVAAASSGALDPGTYNVGERRSYSVLKWLAALAVVAEVEPRLVHVRGSAVPARGYFPFRDVDLTLDTSRLVDVCVADDVPLDAGLRETYAWCLRNGTLVDAPTPTEKAWRDRR